MATILGIGLSVALLGLLFYFQNWEGNREMTLIGYHTLVNCFIIALIFSIVKFFTAKNKKYEIRMSWKILSRYVILIILYYSLNLNSLM